VNALELAVDKDGHGQSTGNTAREPGTLRATARKPNFTPAIVSVTAELGI